MKKLIIEVGANDGREVNRLLEQFPDAHYYGFEPTVELYNNLNKMFGHIDRVNFYPIAISNYNGFATFNVAGHGDWGCSSLFNFSDNIQDIWPGRSDFATTHRYKVPVMKMSLFLDNYINEDFEIEYAWIDAQGSDLNVLESFEHHFNKIKAGRIEVANRVELYTGTNNTLNNAMNVFDNRDCIYSVGVNYGYGQKSEEVDVLFHKKCG
jgi:FkbM family methyltransferase